MKFLAYIVVPISIWAIVLLPLLAANRDKESIILTKDLEWTDRFCGWHGDEESRPPELTERRCELWALAVHIQTLFHTIDNHAFRAMLYQGGGEEAYLFTDADAIPGCQKISIFGFLLTCSGESWAVHYRECQDIDDQESYFIYLLPSTEDAKPTYEGLEARVSDGEFFDDYIGTRVVKVDRGWRIVNPFRPDECSARR